MEQVSVRFFQFHLLFADSWCYHWVTLTQLADVGTVPELQTNGGFRAFPQKSQTFNFFFSFMFIPYPWARESVLTQSDWVWKGIQKGLIVFFVVVFLFFFISQCNWDKFCIINLKMNVKLQQALVKAVLNCLGIFLIIFDLIVYIPSLA